MSHRTNQSKRGSEGRKKPFHLPDTLQYLLRGLLIGSAVFLVLLAVAALCITQIGLNDKEITVIFIACCCISGAASGFFCARKPRKNGILMGLIGSAPLIAIITAVALLVNGGTVGTNMAITVPLTLVLGICGGVMAVNMKKRVK